MAETPEQTKAGKHGTIIPPSSDGRTDEGRYRGENAVYMLDSSSNPNAMGSLPQNNPVATSLLQKGYSPEAIQLLLSDLEAGAKQDLLPEEIISIVPIGAEHKEQLYSMIIIQQRGMTLEHLRKKRYEQTHSALANGISQTVETVAETAQETRHVIREIVSEVQHFFHSIPAWSLRAIKALRRDVQKLIALEGLHLAQMGVTHNPREKVTMIEIEQRGPSRTPALARANAKAQQQQQSAAMMRKK